MKLRHIPPLPTAIILIISLFGIVVLYSINSGHFHPWGSKQLARLCIGVIFMLVGASIDINFWKRHAYLFYTAGIFLLICVTIAGKVSMGAQRWLNLYIFNFQPSELMRIFLILALAKYFSGKNIDEIRKMKYIVAPIALTMLPVALVLLQPDLGTAMLLLCIGIAVFFVCGVQIWKFIASFVAVVVSAPIIWCFLHEYQKNRILTFLSPEHDPLGAGYHIIQSQIAIGSGGFYGKGLVNGTQCQLNFLPEKQTDFVFAALGEELGFVGCVFLICLYSVLIAYNIAITVRQKSRFSKIVIFGLNTMLFFYIFINISMVCGLLPVVGIPLPFFSYGGSALVVLMFAEGVIFSANANKVRNI